LTQSQRRKLCLPRKRGSPGFHPVPGYSVYYQMLIRLNAEVFAKVLSGWLSAHVDTLPEALALEGNYIREQIGLLSWVRHEDGTPIAITPIDQKERTDRSEQARVIPLLRGAPRKRPEPARLKRGRTSAATCPINAPPPNGWR